MKKIIIVISLFLLFVLRIEIQAEEFDKQEFDMKVLLMTTGYTSYYHQQVKMQIDGTDIVINADSPAFSNGDIVFQSRYKDEGIKLLSIERAQGNPVYKGNIILRNRGAGILIINELPVEEYLCGVVPSEMPASYEAEALKAQAVCARTYAYRQHQNEKLSEYGADVDDSINFQMYNNIEEQTETTEAVQDTEGEILCKNGNAIEAYYFSTSSGNTSTDEVWEAADEADYLKSVECLYDADEPWSLWKVNIPLERIQKQAEKKFGTQDKVKRIAAAKLSDGGAVTQLRVYMQGGEKTIHKEYEIRSFLSPYGLQIEKKNGEIDENQTTLPSAYFALEPYYESDTGAIAGYTLYGGGYGHGVGMSQNGANHMAKLGNSYREILEYFFNQITLENINNVSE